jgi:hypothetical protein
VGAEKFANSSDFLEHLNFALGEPSATGLNTLVKVKPDPINTRKLAMGLRMAAEEEEHFLRKKQQDPSYSRQLHGWRYDVGDTPMPVNPSEYQRAYDLASSLSQTDAGKLLGGYGGKRGNKPSGAAAIEEAADVLYNASYGIDTLTGAPLNYKHNAGHLMAFKEHGHGQTRPEQGRVNKALQAAEGLQKLILIDDLEEQVAAAELYAKNPAVMEQLLSELPSSNRETKGWNPELNAMRSNAKRWHML